MLGDRGERAELPALQSHCLTWNLADPYCQAVRIQCEGGALFNKALLGALSPMVFVSLKLTVFYMVVWRNPEFFSLI